MSFETHNPFLKENEPKGPFAIFFNIGLGRIDQWSQNETLSWEEILAWAFAWLSHHDYKGRHVDIYSKTAKPNEEIGFSVYPRDAKSVYVDPTCIFKEKPWIVTFKPKPKVYTSEEVTICSTVNRIETVTRARKPLDIRKLMET